MGQDQVQEFEGPDLEHDALLSHFAARIKEAKERSSDASESSAKSAEFMKETGLNSQAHSWGISILKKLDMKNGQLKAMDVIESLKVMIPLLENHVRGQGTIGMDLEGPDAKTDGDDTPPPKPTTKAKAAAPKAKPAAKAKPATTKAKPAAAKAKAEPKGSAEPKDEGGEKTNVTPINFSKQA